MKLRTQLLVGFLAVIAIYGVLISVTNSKFMNSSKEYGEMIESSNDKTSSITELLISVQQKQVNIRNFILNNDKQYITNIEEANQSVESQIAVLQDLFLDSVDIEMLQDIETLNKQYNEILMTIERSVLSGDSQQASAYLVETANIATTIVENAEVILVGQQKKMDDRSQQLADNTTRTVMINFLFGGLGLIASVIVALVISRIIVRKAKMIQHSATAITAGDLSREAPVVKKARDEMDQSLLLFSQMQQQLQQTIREVSYTAEQVAGAAEELLASSDESAAAADQVANAVSSVAYQATEQSEAMKSSTKDVAQLREHIGTIIDGSKHLEQLSANDVSNVLKGQEQLQKMRVQMDTLLHANDKTNDVMKTLSKQAEEINNIITAITAVADQTNLLALNAAIEAARAGEHGKGFAVVADEVGKLAEQSKQSADEIARIIQNVQLEMEIAVKSVANGTKEVEFGVALTNETNVVFEHIQTSVQQSSDMVSNLKRITIEMGDIATEVSASIEQVTAQSESISQNAEGVAAISEEQQASSEEVAASANSLANSAEQLLQTVSKFKI